MKRPPLCMRRLYQPLICSLTLVFLIGVGITASEVAFAQELPGNPDGSIPGSSGTPGPTPGPPIIDPTSPAAPTDPDLTEGGGDAERQGRGEVEEKKPDTVDNFGSLRLYSLLWTFVNNTFGLLVGITGWLLDNAIEYLVVGFSAEYLGGTGPAVEQLWQAVRDLFNIAFIFGLVFLGFKLILNNDDPSTRSWLVSLIMAALLVNFSLFITKFVIDFTNILATQIVQNGFSTTEEVTNISGIFMDAYGITTVFSSNEWEQSAPFVDKARAGSFGYIFGAAILFIITAFVFAAGAIMIVIRFVALHLYMVLSPLMFLGWVFPQLSSVSRSYWQGFIGRAFFAPVYVLLLYFAAFVMYDFQTRFGTDGLATLLAGESRPAAGTVNALLPFAITATFLMAAVVVANKLGADGAQTAVNMGRNMAQRFGRGARNFAARNTLGYGAQMVSHGGAWLDKRYDKIDAASRKTEIRRKARNVLDLGTLGLTRDKNIKAATGALANASIAGSETYAQTQKRQQERRTRTNRIQTEGERNGEIRTAMNAIRTSTDPAARQEAYNTLQSNVPKMSNDELIGFLNRSGGKNIIQDEAFARNLTDSHEEALRNSGQLRNDELKTISDNRKSGVFQRFNEVLDDAASDIDQLNSSLERMGSIIHSMTDERRAGLGEDVLSNERVAMHLSEDHIRNLETSGKFSAEAIGNIRAARERGLLALAQGRLTDSSIDDPGNAFSIRTTPNLSRPVTSSNRVSDDDIAQLRSRQLGRMMSNVQQAGKLPVSVFAQPQTSAYITPQALEQRMRNGGVSNEALSSIRNNIDNYINSLSGAERTRVQNQWRTWANRSSYGAALGLTNIQEAADSSGNSDWEKQQQKSEERARKARENKNRPLNK